MVEQGSPGYYIKFFGYMKRGGIESDRKKRGIQSKGILNDCLVGLQICAASMEISVERSQKAKSTISSPILDLQECLKC